METSGAIHESFFRRKAFKLAIPIVLGVLILGVLGYIFIFYTKACVDYSCFSESMKSCDRAIYLNEEPQATWRYKITGVEGDSCVIDVSLLNAKKGELRLEEIIGYEMLCYYPRGQATYPEKDLSRCHGRLKEEFQTITIERLHTLIIENLGKIGAGINVNTTGIV